MEIALVFCRLLHFAATMLLFGAAAFVWALAPKRLARTLDRPVNRLVGAAIVVAAVTTLAWLALEAAAMGDGWRDAVNPEILGAVAFETAFGQVWVWRVALALGLIGLLALGRQDRWAVVVPASALLLASLGLVGHAAMQTGTVGVLHRLNQAIHLLCAGAWLGSLPPLVLCLGCRSDSDLRAEVGVTLRRFSGLGHLVVALIVATGVVNIALTLGVWPVDLDSPYRALLAAKIAVVGAMVGIALVNRYILAPRIKGESGDALRALTVNSVIEIGLGLAVFALVSIFGILAPI